MTDVHEPEVRSYNMSQIRGKDTRPEIIVRKFLHSKGFRFRLHDKNLIGRPDIVLRKHNTVIFIHGCFWHGHQGCKYFVIPKTRTEWWVNKINRNREKDVETFAELKKEGWNIITIWECELKRDKREKTLENLVKSLSV
jgi:DNA mismatch endonuclease (patch repair protein)